MNRIILIMAPRVGCSGSATLRCGKPQRDDRQVPKATAGQLLVQWYLVVRGAALRRLSLPAAPASCRGRGEWGAHSALIGHKVGDGLDL